MSGADAEVKRKLADPSPGKQEGLLLFPSPYLFQFNN